VQQKHCADWAAMRANGAKLCVHHTSLKCAERVMNRFANRKCLTNPSTPIFPQNVRTLEGRWHAQCTCMLSGPKDQLRSEDRLVGEGVEARCLTPPAQRTYWVPPRTLIWLWKPKPRKGLF
jgi:hypothetical protein